MTHKAAIIADVCSWLIGTSIGVFASISKPDNPFDEPPELVKVSGYLQNRATESAWPKPPELMLIPRGSWPYHKLAFRDLEQANVALKYEDKQVSVTGLRVLHGEEWLLVVCNVEGVK